MARIDDYRNAVELGKKELEDKNPKRVAGLTGAAFEADTEGGARLTIEFLNRKIILSWHDFQFSFEGKQEEVPIQQQILLLHYFAGAMGSRVTGEWIAYQEIPDGKFYLDAFFRRAKNPMVETFGRRPELLVRLAEEAYGATPLDQGDYSVLINALPLVPVALILWEGDDEFPPEGNILFDRSISDIFSAEDVAWLAGMIIYPLMGMARSSGQESKA